MAIDRQESPYRRGNRYDVMPIPMVAEHCIRVPAGPVEFVVESRRLSDQILADTYAGGTLPAAQVHFDDGGASLHVCDARDGLEHLRFDCFEQEPHYHYIEQAAQANVIVRIDEVAVGDPIDFTLTCVGERLTGMLRNAGAGELADAVARQPDEVAAGVAAVRELMLQASRPAVGAPAG